MARIRSIKPEFFTSEQLAECSTNARLLFVGIWTFSDDQGVHPASIKRLKMEVFPSDPFTDDDIRAMVNQLLTAGLLAEFSSDNQSYWHVTGWKKHQKIDKPTYRYPPPPTVKFDDHSSNTLQPLAEDSPTAPPRIGVESNGVEGNGVEGKTNTGADAQSVTDGRSSEGTSSRKRFVPPTVEEVAAYIAEKGWGVDAEEWFGNYARQGWKLGNGRSMVNWQQAVLTWEKKRHGHHNHGNSQQPSGRGHLRHGDGQVYPGDTSRF